MVSLHIVTGSISQFREEVHISKTVARVVSILAALVGIQASFLMAEEPPPWNEVVVIPKDAPNPTLPPPVRSPLGEVTLVVVYTLPFCNECKEAVDFINTRGAEVEERDLLTLQTLMGPLITGGNKPIIEVIYKDGAKRKVVGFDRPLLETLIPPPNHSEFDLRLNNDDEFDLSK